MAELLPPAVGPELTRYLPDVNAILNSAAALLLIAGFLMIRTGRVHAHVVLMLAATVVSSLFLVSYLTYHSLHGSTRYTGQGVLRTVYLSILLSHTILAAVNVPLVVRLLYLAARKRWDGHRRLARWVFPIWVYVSVTGVVVYWMLYRMSSS